MKNFNIPLDTHNILDYSAGIVLLLCSMLFSAPEVLSARNVFITLGLGLIGYSLITNYRFSVLKLLPLGLHMSLDVLSGLTLMVAPWVFAYNEILTSSELILHFGLGLGVISLVVFTFPKSEAQSKAPGNVTDIYERAA